MKTNIGEVQVRALDVVEGREQMIYMALLSRDKSLSLRDKSKRMNEFLFERICLATGLSLDEIRKLDKKSYDLVENEYNRLNNLGGDVGSDF